MKAEIKTHEESISDKLDSLMVQLHASAKESMEISKASESLQQKVQWQRDARNSNKLLRALRLMQYQIIDSAKSVRE